MPTYTTNALLFAYEGEILCDSCCNPENPGEPHRGPADYIPRCYYCCSRERNAHASLTDYGKVYEARSLVTSLTRYCNDPPSLLKPNHLFEGGPSKLEWYEDLADVLREAWDYSSQSSPLYGLHEPAQKLLDAVHDHLYSLLRLANKGLLEAPTLNRYCWDILMLCESLRPLLNYLEGIVI